MPPFETPLMEHTIYDHPEADAQLHEYDFREPSEQVFNGIVYQIDIREGAISLAVT